MHSALVQQIARDRQMEIARASSRRRLLSSPKATTPSRGGGMLHVWRHASAAHAS